MAYQKNIPLANDQLSQSQQDILGNFQNLDNFKDGVAFLKTQGANPALVADQVGIFTKTSAFTAIPAIFVSQPLPLTGVFEAGSQQNTAGATSAGWTQLPSGIIMKWGHLVITGGGTDVDMALAPAVGITPGPAITTIYNVQSTIVSGSGAATSTASTYALITGTKIRLYAFTDTLTGVPAIARANYPCQVYWFAIGV